MREYVRTRMRVLVWSLCRCSSMSWSVCLLSDHGVSFPGDLPPLHVVHLKVLLWTQGPAEPTAQCQGQMALNRARVLLAAS